MRVSPIALSLATGYASVKPTASHGHEADRMLASADDTLRCDTSDSEFSLLCDNDLTTCPEIAGLEYLENNIDKELIDISLPHIWTIILYPNKKYDWSKIDKDHAGITYYGDNYEYLGTDKIFGEGPDRNIPESPIIWRPTINSNVKKVGIAVNLFCEVETFQYVNAPASFQYNEVTDDNEHGIANVGDVTFSFSESSNNKEMTMKYSVDAANKDNVHLSFFDHGCTTKVASGFGYELVKGDGDPATITAEIDLNLAVLVANGLLWTGSTYSGELKYCVRADVVSTDDIDADQSTNYIGTTGDSLLFVENKYTLTIVMEQDFDDITVVATKEDAENENEDAETSYSVNACQCNDSQVCEQSTLNQNSQLDICIKLNENAMGVVLDDVKSLTLTQGSVTVAAITNKASNSLTNVSGMDSKNGLVKTRLISAFFTDSSGSELTVSGTVVIKFSNASVRQLMNVASEQVRRVQNNEDVAGEGSFDFNVELNAVEEAPSVGSSSGFASIAAIMAMATGFVGLL